MIARTRKTEHQVERGCAGRLRAEEGRDRRDAQPAPGAQRRAFRRTAPTRSPGAMSAPWATTPSCSSGSPTWPSTRASTPHSRPISRPRPARRPPAGARGRRRAIMLSGDGDHPMTKLSDTQAVILSAAVAARRRCGPAAARDPQAHRRRPRQGPRQPRGQGPDRASGRRPAATTRRRCASPAPACRPSASSRGRAGQRAGPGHGRATGRP